MPDRLPALHIRSALKAEKAVVERLLQLYMHDFSEFADAADPFGNVDDQGVFAYAHLDRYWHEAASEPLLFRVDEHLAGFALLNDWSASGRGADKAIAEFFVLRKYRRTGVGRRAAVEIIQARPAVWEIAVVHYNRPAFDFWASVIACLPGYTAEAVAGDGQRWSGTIWRLTPFRPADLQ